MPLTVTRRTGESIMIGDNIKVTIRETHQGKVRVTVEAPAEVAVHRQEVYDRIQEEKGGNGAQGR